MSSLIINFSVNDENVVSMSRKETYDAFTCGGDFNEKENCLTDDHSKVLNEAINIVNDDTMEIIAYEVLEEDNLDELVQFITCDDL